MVVIDQVDAVKWRGVASYLLILATIYGTYWLLTALHH